MNFPLSQDVQKEALYSKCLVNFINDAACCLGVDANFIYVNEATCSLLRYSREELLSMTLQDILPDSQAELWSKQWQEIKQKNAYDFDCSLQRKDKEILSVKIVIAHINEQTSKFYCAYFKESFLENKTQINDIDNQLNKVTVQLNSRQEELQTKLSLLQSAFDSAAYGIIAVSFDGKVLSYNQKFYQLWKIPKSLILSQDSQDCKDFFYSKIKSPNNFSYSVWDISRESAEETYDILELKDGRTFVQESKPWRQEQKIIGRIWSIWDISEFRNKTSEINHQTEQVIENSQQLSELRARFFSTMCHQFRSFLNIISFSNSLLRRYVEQGTDKKKISLLNNIQTAVEDISVLLDRLIFLGKSELGQLNYEPKLTDVDGLCQKLIAQMKPISESKEQSIEYINQHNSTSAWVDEELLDHILLNLLSNAIKYSPNGTKIELILEIENEKCSFKIKDRGMGIPKEEQPRIFEPFYRGSNVNNISGNGLGLAIVKNLVEIQGGQILVESDIDRGTTFTVMLSSSNLAKD